jgi:hypothetical protein
VELPPELTPADDVDDVIEALEPPRDEAPAAVDDAACPGWPLSSPPPT